MSSQSVDLHIEELVFHGFAPEDRHRIGEAFRLELTRLFTERGIPHNMAQGGKVIWDGGEFETTHDAKAEVLSARIAQSVYNALSR